MTNLTRRTLMKGAAATGFVAAVGSRALAADE
ncbi:MAG: twin-arginine translocation signal domain-containing protein, partial [Mesorhizobium sp.]